MAIAEWLKDLLEGNKEQKGFLNKPDSLGINLVIERKQFEALSQGEGEGEELTLTQYVHLKMLEEEGFAERIANGFFIEKDLAVRLEPNLRLLFSLPEPWGGSFEIKTSGKTTSKNYKIAWRLHSAAGEAIDNYKLHGPLLIISEHERYLPSPAQWLALKAVAEHQKLLENERSEAQNLKVIYQIQQAQKDGCDSDLRHFDKLAVISPNRVTANISVDESGDLLITPMFGEELNVEEVEKRLGQIPSEGEDIQSLRVGDTIVLLEEDKLKATQDVIRNRRIPSHLAKQFFKTPTAFLDATLVDLDVGFSIRVKGVTEFRHAYFGETEASEIDWFDRLSEGDKQAAIGPGSLEKVIKDLDDIEQFRDKFRDALSASSDILRFNNYEISIKDKEAIENELEKLEKQINNKYEQELEQTSEIEKKTKEETSQIVVDIEINDEELEISSRLSKIAKSAHWYDGYIDWDGYIRKPYSHQEEGIRWILGLTKHVIENTKEEPFFGGLLADDMGLGKTFMSLAAIKEYYHQCDKKSITCKPVLVVAPLSLLSVWKEEVSKTFADSPFTEIIILHGDSDLPRFRLPGRGIEIRNQSIAADPSAAILSLKLGSEFGVDRLDQTRRLILVNYDTLANYQFSLCRIDWSFVIFDEAQNIKNPNTLQTRAAKGLKALFRLMVTGTPVENSLSDFWCIVDTAVPGLLGEYQKFRKQYVLPLLRAREDTEEVRKEVGTELRNRVGNLMLRRLKEDRLDGLPEKAVYAGIKVQDGRMIHDPELGCVMTSYQLDIYDSVIEAIQSEIADPNLSGNPVLVGLKRLRDVSLHPDLLIQSELPMRVNASDCMREIEKSGKLSTVIKLLSNIQERDEKVLIFATSRRLQAFLSNALSRIFCIHVDVINGETKAVAKKKDAKTRKKIISNFESKSGFNILVMSPIAAGVGLTITGANNVIHLERHWNPAKEEQATDRVYRIGQTRNVNVYIPILHHPQRESFDVNLHRLLSRKVDLKEAVVTTDTIRPEELAGTGLFGGDPAFAESRLTTKDLTGISWEKFEALVAELLARENESEALLTQASNDKGCDVVLRTSKGDILIQCKSTGGTQLRGDSFVREVHAAKKYYQNALNVQKFQLAVYTNARKYTREGIKAAKMHDVQLFSREDLSKLLRRHSVTLTDLLRRLDSPRMEV